MTYYPSDTSQFHFSTVALPGTQDRITINGRTGSGKTQAGAWFLAIAPFHVQPYTIIDYKREALFDGCDRIREISLNDIPKEPGVFRVKPLPSQVKEVEDWLWRIWERGYSGLFIDEGYLLPDKEAFTAILTTGRSKHIPVYTLSQRPVYLPRFVFSEADYYMCFHLNDIRDHKTVKQFVPDNDFWDLTKRLPKYNSRWYSVSTDESFQMRPVPDAVTIMQKFKQRLEPSRKWI
ncbi:MAG: hypothetical protein ACREBU_01520 [Nitrososphaera sp.]